MSISDKINDHYGVSDIYGRIIDALRAAGIEPGAAGVEELAPIDQFHTGGLAATKALAELLDIQRYWRILDAGCGIGGAARYLAETYECNVVGLDLSEDFIAAALPLNELLGLSGQVVCGLGDITDTGIDAESMDLVWSQNVLMNIEDKAAVLREMYRILKPGGKFALQSQMQVAPGELTYPVPWAAGPDENFLCTSDEFKQHARDAGFEITIWTESAETAPPTTTAAPSGLHPGVIMKYDNFGVLRTNAAAAGEAGLVSAAIAVLTKPDRQA